MGSLEEKITRLSPDQRREAEHFIDFILQKGTASAPEVSREQFLVPDGSPSPKNRIILADEAPVQPAEEPRDPLPVLSDLTMKGPRGEHHDRPTIQGRGQKKDPGLLLDWID
jgi:hypothetical protein